MPSALGSLDIGDLLILNLASRKQFWMKRAEVSNQIKTKIPDYPNDLLVRRSDIPENLSTMHLNQPELRRMVVGENGIQINYRVDTHSMRAVGIVFDH